MTTFVLYGAGDARDHATFKRLRSEQAEVKYALLDGANALLASTPGVHRVDGTDAALRVAGKLDECTIVVQRPELLLAGAVDAFQSAGVATIGPTRTAAKLEGSKLFCKSLLREHTLPTPDWHDAPDARAAKDFLRENWEDGSTEWVVKSDRYLSDARRRTSVPNSLSESLDAVDLLDAVPEHLRGARLLLERRVHGPEVSLHALLDGKSVYVCPLVTDYKQLHESDCGPNTHGMGAVASTRRHAQAWHAELAPLAERVGRMLTLTDCAYRGVLYVGVLLTSDGPVILDCNVRPGNPEWQTLIALLDTPLCDVFAAVACGELNESPNWAPAAMSASLFAAVAGYPERDGARCDAQVFGLTEVPCDVDILGEGICGGQPLRAGEGRSLCLVARASNPSLLRERLYGGMVNVNFDGMQVRRDIGMARHLVTEDGGDGPALDHSTVVTRAARDPDREAARARVSSLTDALLEQTGHGLELSNAALQDLDLSGFDLRRATLSRAQLYGTNLRDADLTEATLICPGLERTNFAGASLRRAYMHALGAQVCDFRGTDLRDGLVDATGALFHGCRLDGADLRNAMLSGSSFYQTSLDGAVLDGANLQACQIAESSCVGASACGTLLDDAVFTRVDMQRFSLRSATGRNVVIQAPVAAGGLDLRDANLAGLRLIGVRACDLSAAGLRAAEADIRDCHVPGLDVRRADISRSSWTRVFAAGARLGEAQAEASRWIACVLDSADLRGTKAENMSAVETSAIGASMVGFQGRCAHLRNCDLTDVDLTGAYLYRAMLTGDPPASMKLTSAKLTGAVLVQSYITADLSGADMRNVRGAYARLNQTRLVDADLTGAGLYEASMVKCDLRGASLRGVAPPILADRCPGLYESLDAADGIELAGALRAQVAELAQLLRRAGGLST